MSIVGLHFNICNSVLAEILKTIWFFIVKSVGHGSRLFGIEGDSRMILGGMLNLLPVCLMGISVWKITRLSASPILAVCDVIEWREMLSCLRILFLDNFLVTGHCFLHLCGSWFWRCYLAITSSKSGVLFYFQFDILLAWLAECAILKCFTHSFLITNAVILWLRKRKKFRNRSCNNLMCGGVSTCIGVQTQYSLSHVNRNLCLHRYTWRMCMFDQYCFKVIAVNIMLYRLNLRTEEMKI
jgi:hypothetical protein